MNNFERSLVPLLVREFEKQQPVFQVLTGPRQVGKTTIAQQVMDKLPFPFVYASADSPLPPGPEWIETQWRRAEVEADRSGGAFHTLNEIIESICSALGRKPPRFSLPISPTRALVGLVEKGSRSIGLKPPVTREMIDKYTEDIAVDGNLIQKELGFVPQYDLHTGWEETIREMPR